MEHTFFEISGDPLSAHRLFVGRECGPMAQREPVQPGLFGFSPWELPPSRTAPNTEVSALPEGDFFLTGWADPGPGFGDGEVFEATVQSADHRRIEFVYLADQGTLGAGVGGHRLLLLHGQLGTGDVLCHITCRDPQGPCNRPTAPETICFTPGTMIATPTGARAIEDLGIDDLVITADNGLQPIRWLGSKRITGARLQAFPDLRPIRIQKGALGNGLPERDIWVSPMHRMLLKSKEFLPTLADTEVLVPASSLVNDASITVDYGLSNTHYIHVLFDHHQIIFANSSPTESFQPTPATLGGLDPETRDVLFDVFPELRDAPGDYGPSARKSVRQNDGLAQLDRIGRLPAGPIARASDLNVALR